MPEELIRLIKGREDLVSLGFLEVKNERNLVIWIIANGFKEYPEISKGSFKDNEILRWLREPSSLRAFAKLPRIFLGIWDMFKSHQMRWPLPHLNKFYKLWLEKNWKKLPVFLPSFNKFFSKELNLMSYIESILFDFLWLLRKPISKFTKKYFGFTLDYFFANKLIGLEIQINVINALVYRELKTRISEVRGGILGVFVEPLGVMAIFLLIFSFIRGNRGPLDIELFLTAGVVLYTLFNDIAIRSLNAMQANEALFFYQPVKPVDTVISRAIVESGLYGIVYIVILSFIFIIKSEIILEDFSLLVITFISLAISAVGFGLIIMVAGHRFNFLIQFVPLALRPFWLISGVWFPLTAIPEKFRPFLTWNPITQAIELSRHALNRDYILIEEISLKYLLYFAVISLTTGLGIYLNNEKILLTK